MQLAVRISIYYIASKRNPYYRMWPRKMETGAPDRDSITTINYYLCICSVRFGLCAQIVFCVCVADVKSTLKRVLSFSYWRDYTPGPYCNLANNNYALMLYYIQHAIALAGLFGTLCCSTCWRDWLATCFSYRLLPCACIRYGTVRDSAKLVC